MALKAVAPEVIAEGKPKFMISGRSGAGKTLFALQFPTPYYVDTEGGAVRKQYREALSASGGVYFGKEQGSQDFKTVIDEIKALATTQHNYKTFVLDSFSHIYNTAAAMAEERIGNEFGRDKKEANRPTRQLMRWLENLDMTVILICHHREKWERKGRDMINAGTTFDGFDKLEYILDLWIEAQKLGDDRTFTIRKSRISTFLDGKEFPLNYKVFADLYGRDTIEKPPIPAVMATPGEVAELQSLLDVVRVDQETVDKWLEKANADDWAELNHTQIQKCIDYIKKKLPQPPPPAPVAASERPANGRAEKAKVK